MQLREIPGWPRHRASDDGSIYSLRPDGTWRPLKPCETPYGVRTVLLHRDNRGERHGLARLVLEAFGGEPAGGRYAIPRDGDPTNTAPSNLRWATPAEHARIKGERGCLPRGSGHYLAKLHEDDVPVIRDRVRRGDDPGAIAVDFGVSKWLITRIAGRDAWKHVP